MPVACSLHVNCGGNDVTIRESNGRSVLYNGDANVDGGAAKLHNSGKNWGFSSTGDFMDDNIDQNAYIETLQGNTSLSLPPLYTTARLSPITLTYFSYCLENGEYAVNLHFAEIMFTNDTTFRSLGRRVFDIYIQVMIIRYIVYIICYMLFVIGYLLSLYLLFYLLTVTYMLCAIS